MAGSFPYLRSGYAKWDNGWMLMVQPSTRRSLGNTRMTLSLLKYGEFETTDVHIPHMPLQRSSQTYIKCNTRTLIVLYWLKYLFSRVFLATELWAFLSFPHPYVKSENHYYFYHHRYTSNHPSVYAIVLKWPSGSVLSLGAPLNTTTSKVSMLGYPGFLKWTARTGGGIDIQLPVIPADKQPTPWQRVLKLDNLLNR